MCGNSLSANLHYMQIYKIQIYFETVNNSEECVKYLLWYYLFSLNFFAEQILVLNYYKTEIRFSLININLRYSIYIGVLAFRYLNHLLGEDRGHFLVM